MQDYKTISEHKLNYLINNGFISKQEYTQKLNQISGFEDTQEYNNFNNYFQDIYNLEEFRRECLSYCYKYYQFSKDIKLEDYYKMAAKIKKANNIKRLRVLSYDMGMG